MAQPLDPLRLKGTMLDKRKVAARNLEKTGKEQTSPGEGVAAADGQGAGGGAGRVVGNNLGRRNGGDGMQVE